MADAALSPPVYWVLPDTPLPAGGAEEVGSKAWNLMRMMQAGLPVPPGFVLPTSWCRAYRAGTLDEAQLRAAVREAVTRLEAATGLGFGARRRPLLVSVRSGAAASMPGMMETVLNIGLNQGTLDGLVCLTGNPRLAWDSYRRLLEGYAEVVAGLPAATFDGLRITACAASDADGEHDLDHRALRTLTIAMHRRYGELSGTAFPHEPEDQLIRAILAVLRSWDAPKAATYRRLNHLNDDAGTAVTVQAMVFGNASGNSGAGVGFTRNPATGARELYFDYAPRAQGEDVVAGRHAIRDSAWLQAHLPAVWAELRTVGERLEELFRDAQDFEFTVEAGRLYLLQTRRAKRTSWAALRIAVDMVREGSISPTDGLGHLADIDLESVARSRFRPPLPAPLAHAVVASQGVATGVIALDPDAVDQLGRKHGAVILLRQDMSASDIAGIARADGVLTILGGRTSHAAVVARQFDKVCLVGCGALSIDLQRRRVEIGDTTLVEGDWLSIDGNDGAIYPGRLEAQRERPTQELSAIAAWKRGASVAAH